MISSYLPGRGFQALGFWYIRSCGFKIFVRKFHGQSCNTSKKEGQGTRKIHQNIFHLSALKHDEIYVDWCISSTILLFVQEKIFKWGFVMCWNLFFFYADWKKKHHQSHESASPQPKPCKDVAPLKQVWVVLAQKARRGVAQRAELYLSLTLLLSLAGWSPSKVQERPCTYSLLYQFCM